MQLYPPDEYVLVQSVDGEEHLARSVAFGTYGATLYLDEDDNSYRLSTEQVESISVNMYSDATTYLMLGRQLGRYA